MVGDDAGTGTGMGCGKPCARRYYTQRQWLQGAAHVKALCDPVHVTLAVSVAAITAKTKKIERETYDESG